MTPGFAPRSTDLTALDPLLRQLKGQGQHARRVVLELRHHDWLNERHREETTSFLQEQGVTLASIDGPPHRTTAHQKEEAPRKFACRVTFPHFSVIMGWRRIYVSLSNSSRWLGEDSSAGFGELENPRHAPQD